MHQVKAMLFRSKDLLKNVQEESPKNVNIGSSDLKLSMLSAFRIVSCAFNFFGLVTFGIGSFPTPNVDEAVSTLKPSISSPVKNLWQRSPLSQERMNNPRDGGFFWKILGRPGSSSDSLFVHLHLHPLSSIIIHYHPLSSIIIHYHPSSIIIHYHPSSIITMISRWCWNWQSPNSHPVQRQCCLLTPPGCTYQKSHTFPQESSRFTSRQKYKDSPVSSPKELKVLSYTPVPAICQTADLSKIFRYG